MPFKIQDYNTSHDSDSALDQDLDAAIARVAMDESGDLLYANDSFCTLAGLSPQDIRAASILTLMRMSARKLSKTALKKIESGLYDVVIAGQEMSFHFDWLDMGDGRKVLIACQNADDDDEDDFFAGTRSDTQIKDFAERVQNMPVFKTDQDYAHLIEDQDDVSNFSQMSNDVLIMTSDNGQIMGVNEEFYDLLGYDDDDVEALNFTEIFEEQDRPSIRVRLDAGGKGKAGKAAGAKEFEARILTKFGDLRWIQWRQKNDAKAGKTYFMGRDVTAIKRHEQALMKRERQLMQAEAIGRMGHWHWRVGDERLEWSDQIFSMFGVERAEFSPTIDTLNRVVHRRDLGKVLQAFQHALIQKIDHDMDFRISRPDGDVRYIRCEGRCQIDEDGEVIALYGIMQDMTERMQAEHELRTAKDTVERAYAAKTQFLANMSHELRTPLNAIIGFSEMMQRQLLGPIGTEKYLDYIGGIRESGEHLLDLISDILDMSKIEAGKYDLDLEEINPSKTIRLAVHMMEGRALDDGVKIISEGLKDSKKPLVCDRRAFMQVVLNIMSNAVKFSGSKDNGRIDISCEKQKDGFLIAIQDNGIGIPPNKLNSITNPFEQVSSSYTRDHEGSGLGLSITKELVEMHGGSLHIDSVLHEGTTVRVFFPFEASQLKE